mgnify:CR=1 FL=1
MENEEAETSKPKIKAKIKEKPANQMWENLGYLEQKSKKDDEKAAEFIEPKKAKSKSKKKKVVKKDENQNLNPVFDDDSLTVYGALLSEQLDASPEGAEIAKPAALVGKIISDKKKAELAKKKEERRKKAE